LEINFIQINTFHPKHFNLTKNILIFLVVLLK